MKIFDLDQPPRPCHANPEKWVSDHDDEREEAAHACRPCPARAACYAKAIEDGETWGVWGGVDLKEPRRKTSARKPCAVCGTLMPRTPGHPRRTCIGCVETKPCEQCGESFARSYQSSGQWERAQYCGHRCSRAAQKAALKAGAAA